jgi:hypothetical protein
MFDTIKYRIIIIGLILFSQSAQLFGQQNYLTQGNNHFKKGNYVNADTFYQLFITSLKKQVKYADRFDSAAVWEYEFGERFRKAGVDGSKWYEKSIADYKICRMRNSKLGYFRIFKEMGLSYWYLNDTLHAGKFFFYANSENNKDETVLGLLGECFFSEKKYFEATTMFQKLRALHSVEHPLLQKSINLANAETEINSKTAKVFPYSPSTVFYNIDGFGVYAYNADTDKELKLWNCDSLEQYFGFEHIAQLNDSIVLIHLKERPKDYYGDPDSMHWIRHHFDYYMAINFHTLDSWLYMKRKTIEYNAGIITWHDFDLEITETYYDPLGKMINEIKDTIQDIRGWSISYRGTQFREKTEHHEYFYFRYETDEANGRQIISDTSGLWLKENGNIANIKPYKMTFYGHFPMGYVNPDLSNDGNKVLYIERTKRPWEEWFRRDTNAVHNGALYLMDLSDHTDILLVDYLVYNPKFSQNQNYCGYTKIKLPDYEKNLLEIYNLGNGKRRTLQSCESFIWFNPKPNHKFISPLD